MNDPAIYKGLGDLISRDIPGFSVAYKDTNRKIRFLGWLMTWINPKFVTGTTTTFYPTVYFPSAEWVHTDPGRAWAILAHEYVHLWDRKRLGRKFTLNYLRPQLMAAGALLAILSFLSLYFLLALVLLVALAPWPSPQRRDIEYRGYAMSLAVQYWVTGAFSQSLLKHVSQEFMGWKYYRMEPNELSVGGWLADIQNSIKSGSIMGGIDGIPYRQVHDLIQKISPLKVA